MVTISGLDVNRLGRKIVQLRGDKNKFPDASVIVPVNAQGDLTNILQLLNDVTGYRGDHLIEIILVINNYPPEKPPDEINSFSQLGLEVVSIPNVRRGGFAVPISARMYGIRTASSENTIHFDADCRIPNPTALLDWYISQFENGADVAYTHVDYYGLREGNSIRFRIFFHHFARWIKREILGIPTTRGSNYAVNKTKMLDFFDNQLLADDLNVGPTFRKFGGRVTYSGSKDLIVLTSGRMFTKGWLKLFRYFWYRFSYNVRVLPVRPGVAQRTNREGDPVRKYVNNKPVN